MRVSAAIAGALCVIVAVHPSPAAEPELWLYAPVNFQVREEADRLLALLERGKKAGYSAAVVTDYKFGKLDERPRHYYENLERVRAAADRIGVELIPCVCPIGYSNSVLQNDPNLAAGLPVKECAFVMKDGLATVANTDNLLPGGAFEAAVRDKPRGWDWVDGFGKSTQLDSAVKKSGSSALRMSDFREGNEYGNCRVVKELALKPFHQYRVTLWAKTQDLANAGEFKVNPLAAGKPLNYQHVGLKPTQDWTRHRVVFNSLEHDKVSLYLGLWGSTGGTVWIDDVVLEEVGGVNLIRRERCPVRVTSEDGRTEYVEGRDFERWLDPKLGAVPYAGEYTADHEPPPIVLARGSRIRDGERLKVSFWHTVIVHDSQVCCAWLDEELFKHLRREAELVTKYLRPRRYFLQHDEIRVGGYEERLHEPDRTSGDLLAENARRCVELIREVSPGAEVMVWSDMFDPHHNAQDNYYLVEGTLKGAWEGLDPAVTIVNWNGGQAAESLHFFAGRGHKQVIAGYYDANVQRNVRQWKAGATGVEGVNAWMYTTWRKGYDDDEAFARAVRAK